MNIDKYANIAENKWNSWVNERGVEVFATRASYEDYVKLGEDESEVFLNPNKASYIRPVGNSAIWPGELKSCKPIEELFDKKLSDLTMLEFGCGGGRLTIPFSKKFKYVNGYDISSSAIILANKLAEEKNVKNINLFNAKRLTNRVESNSIDFVFSYIVFQHISNKDTIELSISDLSKVLKENGIGRIHLRTTDSCYEGEDGCFCGFGYKKDKSIGWYKSLCKQNNLKVLEFVGDGGATCSYLTFKKESNA